MTTDKKDFQPRVIHIYMRDQGTFLSTREAGKRAAADFERLTRSEGDVILDFGGVEAATPPFLQEVLDAATALTHRYSETGRIVIAAHLNEDLAETLRYVAHHAKRSFPYIHGGELALLEERPHLKETLQQAARLQPMFTAPELAEELKIEKSAATKRLKALVALGVAVRQLDPSAQHGKRHRYRVADPALVDPEGTGSSTPEEGASAVGGYAAG